MTFTWEQKEFNTLVCLSVSQLVRPPIHISFRIRMTVADACASDLCLKICFFAVLILNAPIRWRQSVTTATRNSCPPGKAMAQRQFNGSLHSNMRRTKADVTSRRLSLQILCVNITEHMNAQKHVQSMYHGCLALMASASPKHISSLAIISAVCVRNEPNNDTDDWTLNIFIFGETNDYIESETNLFVVRNAFDAPQF